MMTRGSWAWRWPAKKQIPRRCASRNDKVVGVRGRGAGQPRSKFLVAALLGMTKSSEWLGWHGSWCEQRKADSSSLRSPE